MIRAIVTGHSRGLGEGIAAALLEQGAEVLGIARASSASLRARFPALREIALDLADSSALAAWLGTGELAAFLAGTQGALLVNNAGVVQPLAPAGKQQPALLEHAMALNVTAPLLLSNAFIAAGAAVPDRRIAHVSSGAGRNAYAGWSAYCAGKAALDMHARAVQADAIPGLRIASVAPGVIDTAMQAELRSASEADFPQLARFLALKEEGGLSDALETGRRFVRYLLSAQFGVEVLADLRHCRD
ncbi:SDR family oxidoreductase [Pseudoduganella rhizocola]|uniref:SDR family oxidoreductase n=1 Tax=Pseudoduganella rhizocola TaxID=3382643 RepID=UPI0038B4C2B9